MIKTDRRQFLSRIGGLTLGVGALPVTPFARGTAAVRQAPQAAVRPRGHEFVFARLRYGPGDWDYNPKVAANILDTVLQYTNIQIGRASCRERV